MTLRRTRRTRLLPGLLLLALASCEDAEQPARPAAAPAPAVPADSPPSERGAAPAAASATAASPAQRIVEQALAYGEGRSDNLVGFLAVPQDAAEPLPGIMLIHDADGLDEGVKSAARRLAAEGYLVLAVDLHGGTTGEADARGAPAAQRPQSAEAVRANLRQAYQYLERYAFAPAVAVVGWSSGGGWALDAALMLPELDAAVLYYPQPMEGPIDLSALGVPVLAFFGGEDLVVPAARAAALESELRALGESARLVAYPRAGHGFAKVGAAGYDAAAAQESWGVMAEFLLAKLKGSGDGAG